MAVSPPGAAGRRDRTPRSRTLLVRVAAGVVLIPLVLVFNHWGAVAFAVFVSVAAALANLEFSRLCSKGGPRPSRLIGILGSVAICFSFYRGSLEISGLVLTGVILLTLLERLARQDTQEYARAVGLTVLGLVYAGWLMGFFILLRNASGLAAGIPAGEWYILALLIITWSYDTLAYLGGSFLGRRPLFSRISPAKTLEGTLIGLAAAVAAALICRVTFAPFLGRGEAVLVGFMIGVVAQAGDLVESIMKRSTNTKDSSHLIPGHGGILDRFDSLLFAGPVFYIYLRVVDAWMG